MEKGRRFFRKKKPKLLLIDERIAPLVLPPPPMNLSLDEEEDILYGEELEESIIEPLRIFIGSSTPEEPRNTLSHIWDLDEESSFEDSLDEPLQIQIGGIGVSKPIQDQHLDNKESAPTVALGVATLSNAFLPEEIFAEIETEEIFVPVSTPDEEQDSVEHVMSKGEWLYTNTEQENTQKSIATLNTALLPIEEESVLLDGELDFSQLDISQTIEEIEARKDRFEKGIQQEDLSNVLTLDELKPQDFDIPSILLRPKKMDHIRVQPIREKNSAEAATDPDLELMNANNYRPVAQVTKNKASSMPYFEMIIAFSITLLLLFLLWTFVWG